MRFDNPTEGPPLSGFSCCAGLLVSCTSCKRTVFMDMTDARKRFRPTMSMRAIARALKCAVCGERRAEVMLAANAY
jgi:hypothetical protein